ncbi:MAG: ABC transporter substrate-binding protein [Bacillota bacterium]|nr:ABC transporter substrate-binding protein [Bacillota bacterium]
MSGKRFWVAMALLAGLLWAAASPGAGAAPPPERVRLSEVVRSVFYAPLYVSINRGFFREEGIEIELSTAWGADKGAAALLSGAVDVGFFGPEAGIYVYQQGAANHFVAFAELTACDGSFLVARRPLPKFRWRDVKGKTIIGGRPGGVPEMCLEYAIRQAGLDPLREVKLIRNLAFTATAGAFEAGTGDFVALFEPTASLLEREGKGYVVASIGASVGPTAYTAFHVRKDYLLRHPETIQRFTNAIYRGQLWVQRHKAEEIVEVIAPFFPEADRDILRRSVERYQKVGAYQAHPLLTRESFERLQDIIQAAGELKERAPYDRLVITRFAQRAMERIVEP